MSGEAFGGFPSLARATAIPNVFFAAVLPRMGQPEELLAFLWASRLVQEREVPCRFVTVEAIWADGAAAAAFEVLGGGREGLERGLAACVALGVLLAVRLTGEGVEETVYFVNNPTSRRTVARARAGDVVLRPNTVAAVEQPASRPGIFRLYEEHIGTITPFVGERLIAAAEDYPSEWIEEAFREAAERNIRNWRYIERILRRWAEEGRTDETAGRDPVEEQKRRYLGGPLGQLVRYR